MDGEAQVTHMIDQADLDRMSDESGHDSDGQDGEASSGEGERRPWRDDPSSTPDDATLDAGNVLASTTSSTDKDTPREQEGDSSFGGLGASGAARLRWEQVRARKAAGLQEETEEHGDDVLWVRVPVRTGQIIRRLATDAKGGNTSAARELRSWLSEVASSAENSVSDLDRRTRRRVLDRVLAEIAEEDETAEEATPAK